ncbi:hypothetical protein [Paraglaciecola aestuariivivens]
MSKLILGLFVVSFIMSYTYNGTQISVSCPVQNISVNKNKVAFADKCGLKVGTFANTTETKQFVSWLLNIK